METTTQNNNELIWTNLDALKKQKLELIKITSNLNKLILEGETVLKRLLTPEEKGNVRSEGLSFLESEVKKLYKFPEAGEEFNLKALGIDLSEIRKYKRKEWNGYLFELNEYGMYESIEEQPIFENYNYYADTENKKKVLEIANSLVKLVDEAHANDSLDGLHLQGMCLAFKNMVVPVFNGKDRYPSTVSINREGIARYAR